MSVLTGRALHEQLSVIMGALTKAAVAEICGLVDEGYAVLQMEINRSRSENQDLRKKLHLIESIVVRGGGGGGATAAEPGLAAAAEGAEMTGARRDDHGGDGAAAPGGDGTAAAAVRDELPDVVLIKDEDSDSDDSFAEDNKAPADGVAAAGGHPATSPPISRRAKRRWSGDRKSSPEQLAPTTSKVPAGPQKKSVAVYMLDSPRSEPGGDELEAGEPVCSYTSQVDPGVQLIHQERSLVSPSATRQTAYFANSSVLESPTNRAELDLSLTWTKQLKNQVTFTQFVQSENTDSDAFGIKLVSVSGSTSTDCQLSESSNSAFEYDDADAVNFAHFRDQSAHSQLGGGGGGGGGGGRGKRFICSICNRTYATSQSLEVHMRIHTGERPFSCDQCGKKFTQSAHLKSHLSVHTGERPYACTLCSRSFIVKYSLKLHMKKCHPNIPETNS